MLEISVLSAIRALIFTMSMIYGFIMLIALTHHYHNKRVYIRILYSPQIIHHPGFLSNSFDSLSGTYRNKKHRVHHTKIFTTIFYPPIALDNLENDRFFFFFFEWQIQFKMQIWEWRPSFTRLMNNKFSCSSILKSQFKFLFCTNTALHPHRQSAYLAIK